MSDTILRGNSRAGASLTMQLLSLLFNGLQSVWISFRCVVLSLNIQTKTCTLAYFILCHLILLYAKTTANTNFVQDIG